MKTTIALLALLFTTITLSADETLWWNPSKKTDKSEMGGKGSWSYGDDLWSTGSAPVTRGNNIVGLFGSGNNSTNLGNSTLNFNAPGGEITRVYIAQFANSTVNGTTVTHTLNFAENSRYTIRAHEGGGSSRTFAIYPNNKTTTFGGNGVFVFNVAKNATLTLRGASEKTPLYILDGYNVTGGNGINFTGPGITNLDSFTILRTDNSNPRVIAREGATLNFNDGSILSGNGTTNATNALIASSNTRLAIAAATVNIDGGLLNVGYRGTTAPSVSAGYGILVGADGSGPATLNLNSGTIKALGEPRSTGISYAGITIGANASTSGGTVNLNGGNITLSNIITATGVKTAILNLNGATLLPSTDITRSSGKPGEIPSAQQIQARLDNFISGFSNNSSNYVALGSKPTTIDTSTISTHKSNGLATIPVPMRDIQGQQGSLVKTGKNALRLTANNTYTGTTSVLAGALVNNGKLAGPVTVAKGAMLAGSGTFTDITLQDAAATFNPSTGCNAKSLSSSAESINLIINLATSTGKDPVLRLQNMNTTATLKIHLANNYPAKTKSITLLKIASNAPKDLKVELFTNDTSLKSEYKDGTLTLKK